MIPRAAAAVPARRPLLPPFHVGNDICRIPRVYRILASARLGPRFVARVLTPEERAQPRCREVLRRVLAAPSSSAGVAVREDGGGEGRRRRQEGERERERELERGQVDPLLWKAAEFMAGR